MTKEIVDELLLHSDSRVAELARQYKLITEHSWYASTLVLDMKLREINDEMSELKGAKALSKMMKYASEIYDFNSTLEKMKDKLTPKEIEQIKAETTDTVYEKALAKNKLKND